MVIDPFGRAISYVRVSVTDRCDFRCVYCMAEDMTFLPKADLLTLEELDRLCTTFVGLGVRKIRLTGGEPLVRRNMMWLVEQLGRHVRSGAMDELTLTTNGSQLQRFAADLFRAGVRRVNVSVDSLQRERFEAITRWGKFDKVMAGTTELAKPSLDPAVAEQIVANLLDAERPLLHVGGGIVLADAADELAELVDHLQIPVSHSLMGKGAVADDNPCVLGMTGFWGTEFVNASTRNADWILALGVTFAEADSSSWEEKYTFRIPDTKLMQIDIDPEELGRNYPLQIGAVADLKPSGLSVHV